LGIEPKSAKFFITESSFTSSAAAALLCQPGPRDADSMG
jgi:hypothetical protein